MGFIWEKRLNRIETNHLVDSTRFVQLPMLIHYRVPLSLWKLNFSQYSLSSKFFTVFSFVLPTMSSNSLRDRLSAIISSLALPYILMSLSYEPLFFMTFSSCVYYWVSMIYTEKKQMFTVFETITSIHQQLPYIVFDYITMLFNFLFHCGNNSTK